MERSYIYLKQTIEDYKLEHLTSTTEWIDINLDMLYICVPLLGLNKICLRQYSEGYLIHVKALKKFTIAN